MGKSRDFRAAHEQIISQDMGAELAFAAGFAVLRSLLTSSVSLSSYGANSPQARIGLRESAGQSGAHDVNLHNARLVESRMPSTRFGQLLFTASPGQR